ncbi:hypothetical protein [Cumulibacter manganitolerans]|uniref:hypothetical protein n=1 Tax=Cumulibacter manganitolerans TaxID=1884992 RepID=UPI001296B9FD|nr:hypothetical protein [Cumulibacter manganitolerans]
MCLLPVVTVLLFLPWSAEQVGPSVDVRSELVWSSVASVVLGALALAFPHRWMSFLAFLPTIGALTDIGTVLWPENGGYPVVVKIVVLVLSAVGVAWVLSALGYPAREQQTRWIVAPVAAALIIATLWLPWVVVSGIGQESGQMAAFDLFLKSAATGASGVTLTRLAILVIMVAGIAGSVLPLTSRKSTATRLAMSITLGAAVGLVLLCLWLSIRGDAVRPSDYASGLRVALAGFVLITLVWNSRLKAAENRSGGEQYPRRIDDSGYIPVIMTGPSDRSASTPQFVAPEPSSSSGDQWRTSA